MADRNDKNDAKAEKAKKEDTLQNREQAIAEGMDARVLPSDEEVRKAGVQRTGRLQEDRNKRR